MRPKTIPMDAAQFCQRALRYFERHQYDKAVKYLRKAQELEPDNPAHYCNLAGVFAECGRYLESNELLQHVLDELAPNFTDCYFYMANNYAYLEQWTLSEQSVITYLEVDEEGEYFEECHELLDYIATVSRRPLVRIDNILSKKTRMAHDEARSLLEAGHYKPAIERLLTIVEEHPDFLPARNNLTAAYLYSNLFERAYREVSEVLKREPNNLHGLCNKALIAHHYGMTEEWHPLLSRLKSFEPENLDQMFKLASTVGTLGEHKLAYDLFVSIPQKFSDFRRDGSFCHYLAVAACNLGIFKQAQIMWLKALELDEHSEVASFYLYHLDRWMKRDEKPRIALKYQYVLGFSEYIKYLQKHSLGMDISNEIEHEFLFCSLEWAIRFGKPKLRKIIADAVTLLGDDALKERLLTDNATTASFWTKWPETWRDGLLLALRSLKNFRDERLTDYAERLFKHFFERVNQDLPELVNEKALAAAAVYLSMKQYGYPCKIEQLAKKYRISPETIGKLADWMIPEMPRQVFNKSLVESEHLKS